MADQELKLDVEDKAFLDHFPQGERSTIANIFLGVIREHSVYPQDADWVYGAALAEMTKRLTIANKWHDFDRSTRVENWLILMQAERSDAMRYAAWCLAWDLLPRSERDNIRTAGAAAYKYQYMAMQKASEAQRALLQRLGYTGDMTELSKASASAMIDRLRNGEQ